MRPNFCARKTCSSRANLMRDRFRYQTLVERQVRFHRVRDAAACQLGASDNLVQPLVAGFPREVQDDGH